MAEILLLAQIGFVVGVSLFTIPRYWRSPNFMHIGFIAISYVIISLVTVEGMLTNRIPLGSVHAFVLVAGYGIGDVALFALIWRVLHPEKGT